MKNIPKPGRKMIRDREKIRKKKNKKTFKENLFE